MPNGKRLPDPITHNKRVLLETPKGGRIPLHELVKRIASNPSRAGHNPRIYKRILRAPTMIERRMLAQGFEQEEITVKQALMTSRLAANYVDHMINRAKEVGAFGELTRAQEIDLWEQSYNALIDGLSKDKRLKNAEEIIKTMDKVASYTLPPKRLLLDPRTKHFRKLLPRLEKGVLQKETPDEYLRREFLRIVSRPIKDPKTDIKRAFHRKAREISLLVSVYADLMEITKKQNWTSTYTETMLRLYPEISTRPKLLNAVINLD